MGRLIKCQQCGIEFNAPKTTSKYCSKKCKAINLNSNYHKYFDDIAYDFVLNNGLDYTALGRKLKRSDSTIKRWMTTKITFKESVLSAKYTRETKIAKDNLINSFFKF